MTLAISVKEVRDITVLELSGKLIFEESTGVHQKVKELIASNKRKFVLNLEDVIFCGSAGISSLAGVYVSVQNCGGELRFVNPSKRIREVLEVTRMSTLFELHDTEEEAFASLE